MTAVWGLCLALATAGEGANDAPNPGGPVTVPTRGGDATPHRDVAVAPPTAGGGKPVPTAAPAAAPAAPVFIQARRFTLAWTHSIERVRWEEDYAVRAPIAGQPARLVALQARVRGSAAGMEPATDAVLQDGWYHWQPARAALGELWLTRSAHTPDYDLCVDGAACRPLAHWLASDGWRTRIWPCRGPTPAPPR